MDPMNNTTSPDPRLRQQLDHIHAVGGRQPPAAPTSDRRPLQPAKPASAGCSSPTWLCPGRSRRGSPPHSRTCKQRWGGGAPTGEARRSGSDLEHPVSEATPSGPVRGLRQLGSRRSRAAPMLGTPRSKNGLHAFQDQAGTDRPIRLQPKRGTRTRTSPSGGDGAGPLAPRSTMVPVGSGRTARRVPAAWIASGR